MAVGHVLTGGDMSADRPTDLLREEHADVLGKLSRLEGIVLDPARTAETLGELRDLSGFFQTEFWLHFDKEEQALFPQMARYIPIDRGPVGVMLREHEELRNSNGHLQAAIADYLAGEDSGDSAARMKEHGTHFIWMLRDHINKEDNMLFMIAEDVLDSRAKSIVSKAFSDIDEEHECIPR
jgi:hemerythrin-like domain-containing protein